MNVGKTLFAQPMNDNVHNGHHRHYFGIVEPIDFISFEDIEVRFEQGWIALKD